MICRHLQKSAYLMDEQQHTQGTQNWLYLKAIANPQIAGNRQANQVIRDYCSLSVVVIVCVSVFCLPVTKVSHYFKSEKNYYCILTLADGNFCVTILLNNEVFTDGKKIYFAK